LAIPKCSRGFSMATLPLAATGPFRYRPQTDRSRAQLAHPGAD
jgi:hypothetical protein